MQCLYDHLQIVPLMCWYIHISWFELWSATVRQILEQTILNKLVGCATYLLLQQCKVRKAESQVNNISWQQLILDLDFADLRMVVTLDAIYLQLNLAPGLSVSVWPHCNNYTETATYQHMALYFINAKSWLP